MSPTAKTTFPKREAAAARNREKILDAARAAFAEAEVSHADVSMAAVARRAGVGMATLYRNFPGREELLEAVYDEEVDELCRATGDGPAEPGAALIEWLRRVYAFLPGKRRIVAELMAQGGGGVRGRRARALEAGQPLMEAAQSAGAIRTDITLEQVFDLIVAVAQMPGDADALEPMLQTVLDGLRAG